MHSYLTFTLVCVSATFFVVDPLAVIPVFLAMTRTETVEHRARTARRAALTAGLTLLVFALAGKLIFRFFGITLPAFKIAGGILLFLLSLDMARASQSRLAPEEKREGLDKEDVAIIPLAIPLLSGPGAIATVMVLIARHEDWRYGIPVAIAIVFTSLATWGLLATATTLQRHMSKTFLNVLTRVMGLILAAIAVEFVLNGVREAILKG